MRAGSGQAWRTETARHVRALSFMATVKVGISHVAQVDDADLALVAAHRWRVVAAANSDIRYAITTIEGHHTLMHRLIAGAARGEIVDHANRDGLDNRRQNLRRCTAAENLRNRKTHRSNRSGLKGVYFEGRGQRVKRWRAQIVCGGEKRTLGIFETKEAAHAAYCAAAQKLHGQFARVA